MPDVSIVTIAHGRASHLANLVRGLALQRRRPRELVIGVMQPERYRDLPPTPFPVRQLPVAQGGLNLAAARNTAADASRGEVIGFLDVDCIPHPDFCDDIAGAAVEGRGLVMGEVSYLPAHAVDGPLDIAHLDAVGKTHSDRRGPPAEGLERCEDYRCFWSLNFAMARVDWQRSGGFDEGYVGYGGEDTDFGRTLHERGIEMWWMRGARAYHQYHPHCMPPVHHLESVVRNAERFASKWGHRTMEHWLWCFEMMGLIEDTPDGLRILRAPSDADLELCRQQSHMPYATTRRVMDLLQDYDPRRPDGRDREREVREAQRRLLRAPVPA